MKTREINPALVGLGELEFIEKMNFNSLFVNLSAIANYYNKTISLVKVLKYYGTEIDLGADQIQVPCHLLEHGGADQHFSARYFKYDRNTGEPRESVYCYKCAKLLTTFWYIYKIETEHRGKSIKEIFSFLWTTFGIEFPRDIILDFDPEEFFVFEQTSPEKKELLEKFKVARELLKLKKTDKEAYLIQLIQLYQTAEVHNGKNS